MIALALAVAALALEPAPSTPVATPAQANATAAAAPADPPPKPAKERLADLKLVYDQTCRQRAYGAYDDLCETLGDQIHKVEREIAAKPAAHTVAHAPVTPPSAQQPQR